MPVYGPWTSQTDRSFDFTRTWSGPSDNFDRASPNMHPSDVDTPPDFATWAEQSDGYGSFYGLTGFGVYVNATGGGGFGTGYDTYIGQTVILAQLPALNYFPPYDPDSIDIEFEAGWDFVNDGTNLAGCSLDLNGIEFAPPGSLDGPDADYPATCELRRVPPADVTYDTSGNVTVHRHYASGSELATRTLLTSDSIPAAGASRSYTGLSIVGSAFAGGGLLPLSLSVEEQRTHVPPVTPADPAFGDTRANGLIGTEPTSYRLYGTFHRPTYRYVYPDPTPTGRPPLAWRQRRDGAATTGPTLAQISAAGGDRPTLAWRQQTP